MTLRNLAQRYQWHCGTWLSGINDTAEPDSAVSMPPWSLKVLKAAQTCFRSWILDPIKLELWKNSVDNFVKLSLGEKTFTNLSTKYLTTRQCCGAETFFPGSRSRFFGGRRLRVKKIGSGSTQKSRLWPAPTPNNSLCLIQNIWKSKF